MRKTFFHTALLLFLSGAMFVGVGCKDYDDDISDLSNRIDQATASISELKALIESGSVITSVENSGNGVVVKLSNGKSYTLTNGADGKDAVVWTIGADGYWYKDGAKTDYKAIGIDGVNGIDGKDGVNGTDGKDGVNGTDGKDGANGADGQNGKDGENGEYYVPNTKTGCFDIYKNGELVKQTEISWTFAAGVSAVLDGNTLRLSNVSGSESDVVIFLGTQLGSVEFVPEVMSSAVAYPTTTDKFYHILSYISEDKFASDKVFIPQTSWDKSNEVAMVYRLNPSDAYVKGAQAAFVNRAVTTRSAFADKTDLLNIIEGSLKYGEAGDVTLKSTVNPRSMSAKINIAALQVWAGQNPVTSDYIHIASTGISAIVANTKKVDAGVGGDIEFFTRMRSVKDGEGDAFVKACVGKVGVKPAHFGFKYDGQIDLKPLAALYSYQTKSYLSKVGFTGISYEFSKPAEYLADDDKKTNQQAYITLEDGVVSVNSEYKTSAIGRTPIIRVDAFMTSNAGEKVLVASSYIKISIERNDPTAPDMEKNTIKIGDNMTVDYRTISSAMTIADMPWERISKSVYDVENLTSTDFWNYYGGANKTYNVKVVATGKLKTKTLINANAESNVPYNTSAEGVKVQVNLNDQSQTSSYVKVFVDNDVLTDHTYGEGGAKYNVEITILSNDKKAHGDFVLTQEFVVSDSCPMYEFNNLYHATKDSAYGRIAGVTNNDIIVVKGQAINGVWEMSSVVSEHFAKKNGVNLFSYFSSDAAVPNVEGLEFLWTNSPIKDVTPIVAQTADFTVALDGAMTSEYLVKAMTLTQTLSNGEKCRHNYDIVFVNPFVAGNANALKIYGNGIGEQKVYAEPEVRVKDKDNDMIYSYDADKKALVLSDKATGEYKIVAQNVNVAYAFDKNEAYTQVTTQMSDKSVLDVAAATGVVTWNNEGATLMNDYNLTVVATVTFEDLSVVKCEIPVKLSTTK